MPNLTCSADRCVHNCSGCCNLNCIDVEGASVGSDTCCLNFAKSYGGLTSAVGGEASHAISVHCKAADCVYQHCGQCQADSISICRCGSGGCEDTRCSTYTPKQPLL